MQTVTFKSFLDNLPAIIDAASKSPLGICSLLIALMAFVALVFFWNAEVRIRLFVFILLLVAAAAAFGTAIAHVAPAVIIKSTGSPISLVAHCTPEEKSTGDPAHATVPSVRVFRDDGTTPFSLAEGQSLAVFSLGGHVNFRTLGGDINFAIRPESGGAPICPVKKALERNGDHGTYPDSNPASGAYLNEDCRSTNNRFSKSNTGLRFGEHGGTPFLCSDSDVWISGEITG